MNQRIINAIKEDWRIQTGQFEYLPHLKFRFAMWHLVVFVGTLLSCFILPCLGLLSVPCVISWNYFVLFDKRRHAFKDDYRLKRYELIGTIWASFVVAAVIVGLILSWSFIPGSDI